jgi:GGDEF domain-containing protein
MTDPVLVHVEDRVATLTVNDPERRNAVTAEISAALRAAGNRGAQGYTLNFSPGIAIFDPASPVSLRELMATGDNAMYAAKQAKRR